MAGGLNLYGYAGGDPVNFSDLFGLSAEANSESGGNDDPCKADANSMACKNYQETDALAAELESVCRADVKEATASVAAAGVGLGALEAGSRVYKTMQLGWGMPSRGLAITSAVGAPVAVLQSAAAGGTSYNHAAVTRAKFLLDFIPGAGPTIETVEAAISCRDARVHRARANGMR